MPRKQQPEDAQRKRRGRRLKITKKQVWEKILGDVNKDQVPVHCLEGLDVNLRDGTVVRIDVYELLVEEGLHPDEVEVMINSRLEALDHIIEDVDFYINVDYVADTIQPLTDELLKKLK